MATYKETFENNGIILALKNADTEKYNEIFGSEYDFDVLDNFIAFMNGEYTVTEQCESLIKSNQLEMLAKMIWTRFYSEWKTILKTLDADYAKGYEDKIVSERNKENKNTVDNTSTDTNKVFAYNSETASNDSMNDSVNNTDSNGTEKDSYTETKSGYNYGTSLFDIVEKYKNYEVENNFTQIVKDDIIKFVCYTLY